MSQVVENNSNEQPDAARRLRRIPLMLLVCAVAACTVGGYALCRRYYGDPKRFAIVDAGILYRSAQPKPAQIRHMVAEYGVKTIIIAREGTSRSVPDERQHAEEAGASVEVISIESRQPVTDEQIEQFFRAVDDSSRRPVWVHCSAGRHRTGLLCALYRIERQGWPVERAMEEMLSFGFNTDSQSAVCEQLKAYRPGRFARRSAESLDVGSAAP
ncbi:MAG: tyrosine-protein phosphatase [Phycisphaerae bacterium]|nr:tyrosine-protein phosphatase [Phycisphaerae bacterium]